MVPFVVVTVQFWDGTADRYFIGEGQEYWGWRLNEDNCLVFKTHNYCNRTVVPLANVKLYSVNRYPAEPRETKVNDGQLPG
jgi:hypothetical protein